MLERFVHKEEVEFSHQAFQSPYHFIQILYWLFGGLIVCIEASFYLPLSAFVLSAMIAVSAFRYFDWRSSFITKLPPQIETYNFRAKRKISNPKHRLVLMAHWDTAPISLPYLPSMISDFRRNLFVLMLFITGVAALCILQLIGLRATWQFYASLILALFFLLQVIIVSWDYWRFGYSNGANDNATGAYFADTMPRVSEQTVPLSMELI